MMRQVFGVIFLVLLCLGIYFYPEKIRQIPNAPIVLKTKAYLDEKLSSFLDENTQTLRNAFRSRKEQPVFAEPLTDVPPESVQTVQETDKTPFKEAFSNQKAGFETSLFLEKNTPQETYSQSVPEKPKKIQQPSTPPSVTFKQQTPQEQTSSKEAYAEPVVPKSVLQNPPQETVKTVPFIPMLPPKESNKPISSPQTKPEKTREAVPFKPPFSETNTPENEKLYQEITSGKKMPGKKGDLIIKANSPEQKKSIEKALKNISKTKTFKTMLGKLLQKKPYPIYILSYCFKNPMIQGGFLNLRENNLVTLCTSLSGESYESVLAHELRHLYQENFSTPPTITPLTRFLTSKLREIDALLFSAEVCQEGGFCPEDDDLLNAFQHIKNHIQTKEPNLSETTLHQRAKRLYFKFFWYNLDLSDFNLFSLNIRAKEWNVSYNMSLYPILSENAPALIPPAKEGKRTYTGNKLLRTELLDGMLQMFDLPLTFKDLFEGNAWKITTHQATSEEQKESALPAGTTVKTLLDEQGIPFYQEFYQNKKYLKNKSCYGDDYFKRLSDSVNDAVITNVIKEIDNLIFGH